MLNNFISYADYHFASEEKEMVRYNYPDYEVYRGKHQVMLEKWDP
jgi:hemerythrin